MDQCWADHLSKSRGWCNWQIELTHHLQFDNSYCLFAHLAICIHISSFNGIQRRVWNRKWHLFCPDVASNSRNPGDGWASNRLISLDFCKCSIYVWTNSRNSHWGKSQCSTFLYVQNVHWGLLSSRCLAANGFEVTDQHEYNCQGVRKLRAWHYSSCNKEKK